MELDARIASITLPSRKVRSLPLLRSTATQQNGIRRSANEQSFRCEDMSLRTFVHFISPSFVTGASPMFTMSPARSSCKTPRISAGDMPFA